MRYIDYNTRPFSIIHQMASVDSNNQVHGLIAYNFLKSSGAVWGVIVLSFFECDRVFCRDLQQWIKWLLTSPDVKSLEFDVLATNPVVASY